MNNKTFTLISLSLKKSDLDEIFRVVNTVIIIVYLATPLCLCLSFMYSHHSCILTFIIVIVSRIAYEIIFNHTCACDCDVLMLGPPPNPPNPGIPNPPP